MRLQGLILDKASPKHLFVRGGVVYNGTVIIRKGSSASFDTFYNSFSYTKYRKYTRVNRVSLNVGMKGCAEICLCVYDGTGEKTAAAVRASGHCALSVDLSELPDSGFLYARVNAETDCTLLYAEYVTEELPDDISVCVAICTYHREDFVKKNTERLRSAKFSFIDRVLVVDNGNSLDAGQLNGDIVSVLPNRNLGGSGGFTRGLLEAEQAGHTHVMLMDDDIEFYTESLERMTVLVSLLKSEYAGCWFSAAMIPLDDPECLYEMGAEWSGGRAVIHKNNVDITDRDVLLDDLADPGADYGGWWTLLMPLSVTDNGLPLPLFIKFDDVEYGLRRPDGADIITMNGAAVRHEAFDRKESFVLDYYNLRNELIMEAVHGGLNAGRVLGRFWRGMLKECMLYRYGCCELIRRAAEDFLLGSELLMERSGEDINSEVIGLAPKMTPLSDIGEWTEKLRCDDTVKDMRITVPYILTAGGYLIPPFLLKGHVTAVPASRTGTGNMFRRRTVIQYQIGGSVGVVTTRSFLKAAAAVMKAIPVSVSLLFGYRKAQKSLREDFQHICSRASWERRLGLSFGEDGAECR